MKRIQEKVKDLVEVRVYSSLQDFSSIPGETLAAYHFTDATSDLMAKWLDSLAGVQDNSGASLALAGYRGVGKSHFFAAFGAIAAHPELRSKVTNSFVAASAQQLKRRRYPVAFARRGTHETLLEEIKDAIAVVFEIDGADLIDDLPGLVKFTAEKAGDLPFVLLIDTAFERVSRVARDDGAFLGELAEVTRNLNFFVAVALDDDIARADGVNAAIVQNYTIDYLDQEHLYKVVESHIFPKHRQTGKLLHDIYENFREVLPGFRWSERRFISLYPVHPVILETAQFIRLYAPDFTFLGFASEAGNKVLGRPANSLVALDEVFDRVESSLRRASDLNEAFETYDRINAEIISNIPVMQRLQAKLVLKALLLLSLDGDGTTANEIGAAMLVYDESDRDKSRKTIEDLLESFAAVFPEQIHRKADGDRETRFSLKVSGKDSLNDAIAASAQNVSSDVFENILRRLARERFPDWMLQTEDEPPNPDITECQVSWRGGFRRGRIIWNWQAEDEFSGKPEAPADFIDWEVTIGNLQSDSESRAESAHIRTVVWQPAKLRLEEEENLRRYYVLLTDKSLRESFGEQVHAAGHTLQNTVGLIWKRIFLEDGNVLIDGAEHKFSETARASATLTELMAEVLTPLFEARYPQHPVFEKNLGINEVAMLVSEHFSGAKPSLPEVQELAKTFALPLGLAFLHGNNYILNSDEKRVNQPFIREIMSLIEASGEDTVSLKTIYRELKKEPLGLVHESVHLILAALVAQRHLEFVTTKGDRINRRSLDLQIIWDDIVGIAAPSTVLYGSAKLTDWARTLTAADDFKTIDDPTDREKIKNALKDWLTNWRRSKILERFEELPAEILTTKTWRLETHCEKTFGVVATTVESVLDESISLEEGLQRVADAFSDSESEFLAATGDLVTLEDFINGVKLRETVWQYLAVCEATEAAEIETLRENLMRVLGEMASNPNEALNQQLAALWQEFQPKFAEHFAVKHYSIMKSHHLQEKFDEILRSDEWWEFENLSTLPVFQKTYWNRAQEICRRLKELNCDFNAQEMLKSYPFCACSFRLAQINEWEKLPQRLSEVVIQGRKSYRKTLAILSETLTPLFEHFIQTEKSSEFIEASRLLSENLAEAEKLPTLDNAGLVVLRKAIQSMPSAPLLQISVPTERGFLTREELRSQLSEWLDELPSEPVLLKI
ncbi:MAG: DUF6079 family protein [Pyrinomonadaceae bacterium]